MNLSKLQRALEPVNDRLWALSERERVLLFLALVGVVAAFWWFEWAEPRLQRWSQLDVQIEQTQEQVRLAEARLLQLAQNTVVDPNLSLQQEIDAMIRANAELPRPDLSRMPDFVMLDRMTALITDLVRQRPGVQLVALERPAPELVFTSTSGTSQQNLRVFRQKLRLIFQGDFAGTVMLLREIEQLPWRLSWDGIEYRVINHPNAQVTIDIHVLSLGENPRNP